MSKHTAQQRKLRFTKCEVYATLLRDVDAWTLRKWKRKSRRLRCGYVEEQGEFHWQK